MADENPIERLRPGQILADSAVTDYIKAMGIAIAEAQMQLDINSLRQVGEYVQPREGLGGKSLLELGLSPPFYHYQHADLTVSMQIVMKIGEQSAFGIGAKLDFGFGQGGRTAAANAREAQITLRSLPGSVTANGRQTDTTGSDLEAAGEQIATALRAPTGPFERATPRTNRRPVRAALEPASARNPVLTPGALAFFPSDEGSTGIIRITQTPPPPPGAGETFVLAAGKETTVPGQANRTLYARQVVTQINALGGFRARLVNDAGGSSASPDAPGALGIALFDTGSARLRRAALDELQLVARSIRDGNLSVVVTGYGDTRNTDEFNRNLGQQRADAVKQQLVANGVDPARIRTATGGEERWRGTPDGTDNQQFRRAEITLDGSTDLFIMVENNGTQLQATPLPNRTDGSAGNGFILARRFAAQPVDGTALKVGESQTSVAISGAAVNVGEANHPANSPEAFAFNLARDINANSATHRVRATQQGRVVMLSNAEDAVIIDLVSLSANEITLTASGGASVTRPIGTITPGPTASQERPNVSVAVGLSVDYRKARQFEQSVNGNSSISTRLVAVPAPVEFLDEIKQYLSREVTPAPPAPPAPQG
jgi:outer membrane protein OmpA-like peptidoglycan-associated protein